MLSLEKDPRFCPYCGNKIEKAEDNSKESYYCNHCKRIIYRNPVPVVVITIFNKNHEVLLVRRKEEPGKGMWALPSGFLEIDEEPSDAAKRELLEETGITADELKLLNVFHQKSERYKSVTVIVYMGFSDKNPEAGDDAEDARFFPPSSLPEIPFESHLRAIKCALRSIKI